MPSFRTGTVKRILETRAGLQRVEVDLGDGPERAYVLTHLTGDVADGDRVVVNTTAVELGLGTGGWHVVHWNLARDDWHEQGPGHIMKGRYTSLQADVGSAEEDLEALAEVDSIGGIPVVAAALHSQVPAVAVAFKQAAPDARLVYVMTDGAALPLALSDLIATLRDRGLLDATVTCGHAFGGDFEAVSIFSALAVARYAANADAVVVAMGPGIVGTNTRLGFSGMEVGPILDAAAALEGDAIACLRVSFADPRERHFGLSHHSATALPRRVPRTGHGGTSGGRRRARDAVARGSRCRRHHAAPRCGRGRAARRARALRGARSPHLLDGPPGRGRSDVVSRRRRRRRARGGTSTRSRDRAVTPTFRSCVAIRDVTPAVDARMGESNG